MFSSMTDLNREGVNASVVRSNGLLNVQYLDNIVRSFFFACSSGSGSVRPNFSHLSAANTPAPPVDSTIRTPDPLGNGRNAKAFAMSYSSSRLFACMTPACFKAASKISDLPASALVWEKTARAPAFVIPPFKVTIGFVFDTSAAAFMKALPLVTPSR